MAKENLSGRTALNTRESSVRMRSLVLVDMTGLTAASMKDRSLTASDMEKAPTQIPRKELSMKENGLQDLDTEMVLSSIETGLSMMALGKRA